MARSRNNQDSHRQNFDRGFSDKKCRRIRDARDRSAQATDRREARRNGDE